MFDNSMGGFSGILHPLWNWGAEAANRPPPPPLHKVAAAPIRPPVSTSLNGNCVYPSCFVTRTGRP
jgi:hypothetical protein